MDFIKDDDIAYIMSDGQEVGYIKTDRNSLKRAIGYFVRFYSKVWGYNFGEYKKTFNEALMIADIQYSKMLNCISENPYYSKELDMYFPSEDEYRRFAPTIITENKKKNVQKRIKEPNKSPK